MFSGHDIIDVEETTATTQCSLFTVVVTFLFITSVKEGMFHRPFVCLCIANST